MSATRTSTALLAAAVLIAGCPASNTPQTPGKTPGPTAVKPNATTPAKTTTALEGSVKAPSSMVVGRWLKITSATGWRRLKERPRSPCIALVSQSQYWTMIGRSNP